MTLPRPTVTSESSQDGGSHRIDVTISREAGKGRTYTGVGSTTAGAARELVEKIIEDHNASEFIKEG